MGDSKSKVTETVVQVAFEGTQTVLEIGPFGPGFMACITLTEYGAGTVLPAARELAHKLKAAPEMLEALRDIVEQAERTKMAIPPDLADSIRVFARAAIAKATGKAP